MYITYLSSNNKYDISYYAHSEFLAGVFIYSGMI